MIKKILVSQPKPELERSPYFEIERNFNVEMSFRPFVQVEGIPARDFRKNRVDILSYTAVIMTSKNAVDHFFRICNEMRIIVPETMKYFCISEAIGYYLQKYIQFRKRKIFFSNRSYADLIDIIKKKHKDDKFLLPCSDAPNEDYTSLLTSLRYAKAPIYRAMLCDLKDIVFSEYDMIVLFSSAGVTSLFASFPDFKQNNTVIAAWGEQTAKAVVDAGLKLHLIAPQAHAQSMAAALELYLKGTITAATNQTFLIIPHKAPPVIKPKHPSAPAIRSRAKKEIAKEKKPLHKPAPKVVNKKKETEKKQEVKKITAKLVPVAKKSKPIVQKIGKKKVVKSGK